MPNINRAGAPSPQVITPQDSQPSVDRSQRPHEEVVIADNHSGACLYRINQPLRLAMMALAASLWAFINFASACWARVRASILACN